MTGVIINSVLLMGILILIGYFLKKKDIINEKVEKSLTFILLYICVPGLIIKAFDITYTPEKLRLGLQIVLISVIHSVILIAVNYLLIYKIKDKEKKKILKFGNVITNFGFMGYPVVFQIFGEEGLFFASMYSIPIIILMWTYGLSTFFSKIGKEEVKNIFLNPGMIALYFGINVFIFSIEIPDLIDSTLITLGNMTTPLSMFIIGSRLALVKRNEILNDKMIYYGAFVKLILSPILMLIILNFIQLPTVSRGVAIIYGALPPAAIIVILARQYKGNTVFSSKIVVIQHILSLATITFFLTIFL